MFLFDEHDVNVGLGPHDPRTQDLGHPSQSEKLVPETPLKSKCDSPRPLPPQKLILRPHMLLQRFYER